jgi:acyl-CoA dehydrogenase
MGIRTAYVADFDVEGHEFGEADVVCRGRAAWEAVFATVNLGKFFLGFGSIGMCEHALHEARAHTGARVLYTKPVAEMPHIRAGLAHAYAKLTAMKLFAYRALDYVHAANANDRRYLLFAAVQKAKVSSEGVKVMALLSECVGAKGFESDTYFEGALRDVPLIPSLEGSTHINFQMAAQFLRAYFTGSTADAPAPPKSLVAVAAAGGIVGENPYLMESELGDARGVRFANCLDAYRPLAAVANVRRFARQVKAFRLFLLRETPVENPDQDIEVVITLGRCLSAVAYGQLVAEHCVLAEVPPALVSVLFHQCVEDLTLEAMRLAALPQTAPRSRRRLARVQAVPRTSRAELDFVASRVVAGD